VTARRYHGSRRAAIRPPLKGHIWTGVKVRLARVTGHMASVKGLPGVLVRLGPHSRAGAYAAFAGGGRARFMWNWARPDTGNATTLTAGGIRAWTCTGCETRSRRPTRACRSGVRIPGALTRKRSARVRQEPGTAHAGKTGTVAWQQAARAGSLLMLTGPQRQRRFRPAAAPAGTGYPPISALRTDSSRAAST
jgi:hypothetical protein